jgi:hypothetical protein
LGTLRDLTAGQMQDVVQIARLIAFVQPGLSISKYFEYAYGIHVASETYAIDPVLLIAITHQETSFRENLPEGRAGELGICQIRKIWLRHRDFRKEFGNATLDDLRSPSKSFLFAAWILRDLKNIGRSSRTLPYWCYYNSVMFENRLKYFVSVNRTLVTLKRSAGQITNRTLASMQRLGRVRAGHFDTQ